MNGVTGRMGANQHLGRSILAIIEQGGVKISDDETIMPRPLLVGRNAGKLETLARESGGLPWTTDLDSALADSGYSIYFDAQTTDRRAESVRKAIAAGKHVYCEKPSADSLEAAYDLYQLASQRGRQAWRCARQAVAAGTAEIKSASRSRFFWQDIFRPRRIRLLGV